jgi:hypothetical protein
MLWKTLRITEASYSTDCGMTIIVKEITNFPGMSLWILKMGKLCKTK